MVEVMSTTRVQVRFDGDIVRDGSVMDARVFGSSLVSLADAYGRASQIIHPGEAPPHLDVKSTGPGSFLVDLIVGDPGWTKVLYDVFKSEPAQAVSNAAQLAGAVIGATGFLKRVAGRYYEKVAGDDNSLSVTIIGDNNTITLPAIIVQIAEDELFVKDMAGFARPVFHSGDSSVSLSSDEVDAVVIEADDAESFNATPKATVDVVETSTMEMVLTVGTLSFQGKGSWKFMYEGMPLNAKIRDEDFQRRIDLGEQFGKGTRLVCMVRITANLTTDKQSYEIVKVLNKIDPGRQVEAF